MATHSSVLAWRIPGTGVTPVGCHPWGRTELDMTEATEQHLHYQIKKNNNFQLIIPHPRGKNIKSNASWGFPGGTSSKEPA